MKSNFPHAEAARLFQSERLNFRNREKLFRSFSLNNNALSDGSMDQYIADAQELASDEGNVYEGQLDADGKVASN